MAHGVSECVKLILVRMLFWTFTIPATTVMRCLRVRRVVHQQSTKFRADRRYQRTSAGLPDISWGVLKAGIQSIFKFVRPNRLFRLHRGCGGKACQWGHRGRPRNRLSRSVDKSQSCQLQLSGSRPQDIQSSSIYSGALWCFRRAASCPPEDLLEEHVERHHQLSEGLRLPFGLSSDQVLHARKSWR